MRPKQSALRTEPGLSVDKLASISHQDLEKYSTEHIYIEDELGGSVEEPKTVSSKLRIQNRVKGILTELTFYREGFLRIRTGTPRKMLRNYVLELRFINPAPVRRRKLATRCLWFSVGAAVVAMASWVLLPMTSMAGYSFTVTTLLATLATICLLVFVHRSEETYVFYTAIGKTEVLSLTASFGCLRLCRKAVQAIRGAVNGAQGNPASRQDIRYLKAEMQAHYRLAETGIISREACSEGTALILARFG